MRYKSIFFLIPVVVLSFAFSNCGDFEVLDNLANASSQTCTAKMRAKVSVDFPASICEDISNFACERRIFKPGIEAGSSIQVECLSLGRKVDSCVSVTTLRFDTAGAREGSESKEFELGGEYNREEVQCWNTKVQKQNVSIIHSEANSLEEALSSTLTNCQERSTQ